MASGALLDVCFDCPACGTQLEAVASIDAPSMSVRAVAPYDCEHEDAMWHAVRPVTCEECGQRYSIVELNESAAVHQAVMDAEVNEQEAYR